MCSLGTALTQVEKLKGRGDQASALNQIKYAALRCRQPLEEFLAKIQKYENSLGSGKSVGKLKDAGKKIQYAVGKDEANALRTHLQINVGFINMSLARLGLEMLDTALRKGDQNQEELRNRIEYSSKELKELRGDVEAQTSAVGDDRSVLQNLLWVCKSEIVAPLKSLGQTVTQI